MELIERPAEGFFPIPHVLDMSDDEYAAFERDSIQREATLCPECPSPGDCMAEAECVGRAEARLTDGPTLAEWDVVE
jgi:hypothetical protein